MDSSDQYSSTESAEKVTASRRGALKAGALKAGALAVAALKAKKAKADFAPVRSLPVIVSRAISKDSDIKNAAIADYKANMRQFGGSLSRHGSALLNQPQRQGVPWNFDVLIIGSGYGASICAARLAMAKQPHTRIAVVERGREWVPGTFGDTLKDLTDEARFKLLGPKKGTVQNPVGLMNLMRNDEVNVLAGNGLGGSSLINANVAIRPDHECFQQSRWPVALRDRRVLDPYYDRAGWELGVAPELADLSPKSRAQRLAANNLKSCGVHFERASLTVTRNGHNGATLNRQGMRQRGCIGCGDCCSGCNVGAKNTLATNYLPLAKRFGAELFTHTEVMRVEKGRWLLPRSFQKLLDAARRWVSHATGYCDKSNRDTWCGERGQQRNIVTQSGLRDGTVQSGRPSVDDERRRVGICSQESLLD